MALLNKSMHEATAAMDRDSTIVFFIVFFRGISHMSRIEKLVIKTITRKSKKVIHSII